MQGSAGSFARRRVYEMGTLQPDGRWQVVRSRWPPGLSRAGVLAVTRRTARPVESLAMARGTLTCQYACCSAPRFPAPSRRTGPYGCRGARSHEPRSHGGTAAHHELEDRQSKALAGPGSGGGHPLPNGAPPSNLAAWGGCVRRRGGGPKTRRSGWIGRASMESVGGWPMAIISRKNAWGQA